MYNVIDTKMYPKEKHEFTTGEIKNKSYAENLILIFHLHNNDFYHRDLV